MDTEDKVQENYCRRWAKRLGLQIKKSRAKWSLDNRGGYMIIEINHNFILGGERFDLRIEDVEKFLEDYQRRIST